MYSIRLEGDTQAALRRIRSLSEIDRRGINAALGQTVRESTLERFQQSRGPDGRRWKTSIRAAQTGGKTLVDTCETPSASIRTTAALQSARMQSTQPPINLASRDERSALAGQKRCGFR